jgi:hypothetical protein
MQMNLGFWYRRNELLQAAHELRSPFSLFLGTSLLDGNSFFLTFPEPFPNKTVILWFSGLFLCASTVSGGSAGGAARLQAVRRRDSCTESGELFHVKHRIAAGWA